VQNVGIRAIVASPLAISALFNPLRKWVQASVDLRFNRRKYHARITLAAFSAKLKGRDRTSHLEHRVSVSSE
jgi:hypothetical protein